MTPMALVVEHARRQRDEAAASQARTTVERDTAARTLATLKTYRDEQADRARSRGASPQPVSGLLHQTRFAGTLDEAIRLQAARVGELDTQLEACRAAVLRAQQRLKALETIVERRRRLAEHAAARREQQATDEHAANRHARAVRERQPS